MKVSVIIPVLHEAVLFFLLFVYHDRNVLR